MLTATSVVDAARRAPSLENTQPWAWFVQPGGIELWADRSRWLADADPAGRGLAISCGAAVQHAQVAARALGRRPEVRLLPDPGAPDLVARLRLLPGTPDPAAQARHEAIGRRVTDRRRFTAWPVPDDVVGALARAAAAYDVAACPVGRPDARRRLAPLLDEVSDTDTLVVLATGDDGPVDRVRAGEALSALWLEATLLGLSVVPLARGVEDPACRAVLATETTLRHPAPQLLLRLGWQRIDRDDLPRTPRRPLRQVLRRAP